MARNTTPSKKRLRKMADGLTLDPLEHAELCEVIEEHPSAALILIERLDTEQRWAGAWRGAAQNERRSRKLMHEVNVGVAACASTREEEINSLKADCNDLRFERDAARAEAHELEEDVVELWREVLRLRAALAADTGAIASVPGQLVLADTA